MSDLNLDEGEDDRRDSRPAATKFCFECGEKIRWAAEFCPKCGIEQPMDDEYEYDVEEDSREFRRAVREYSGSKMAAGICGILAGSFGVHKFILGMTTPGLIMLLVTVLTCGVGALPMYIIGMIEGITYLTKSDRDFYLTYVKGRKAWF